MFKDREWSKKNFIKSLNFKLDNSWQPADKGLTPGELVKKMDCKRQMFKMRKQFLNHENAGSDVFSSSWEELSVIHPIVEFSHS